MMTKDFDIKTFTDSVQSQPVAQILSWLIIKDEESHEAAVSLMGELMDHTGDVAEHSLYPFMTLLENAIAAYEAEHYELPNSSPAERLKYLMVEHGLKQTDIAKEFGGQGIVSQVLSGKRKLNKQQIKALSERFNVSPAIFF